MEFSLLFSARVNLLANSTPHYILLSPHSPLLQAIFMYILYCSFAITWSQQFILSLYRWNA